MNTRYINQDSNFQVNSTSLTKTTPLDKVLIHRRLMHLHPDTITTMCSKQILRDLPSKTKSHANVLCNCTICFRSKFNHPNRGMTVNTDNLKKGNLLHIDFQFYDIVSIRGFSSILSIIDAKTRKLWCFPGPDKRPPITKIKFSSNV